MNATSSTLPTAPSPAPAATPTALPSTLAALPSKLTALLLSLSCGLLLSAAATAQDVTEDEAQPRVEEIVVTGSRLPMNPLNSPFPLVQISREDILATGHAELSEVLLDHPGFGSSLSTSSNIASTTEAGFSTVSLRGIGSQRTLLLIDGRRVVSNSPARYAVDLASIPNGFLKRIDIITGAASAVYGSDAISGVVNFITEDEFEGLEFTARAGRSARGGRDEEIMHATFGSRFMDDRGYFILALSAGQRDGLSATERERSLLEVDYDWDCDDVDDLEDGRRLCVNEYDSLYQVENSAGELIWRSGDQPVSRYYGPDADLTFADNLRDRSNVLPGGGFDTWRIYYDEDGLHCSERTRRLSSGDTFTDCGGPSGSSHLVLGQDGFNRRLNGQLSTPRDRLSVSARLNYDFDNGVTWGNTLMYSGVDVDAVYEPQVFNSGTGALLIDPETGEVSQFGIGGIPRFLVGSTSRSAHPFIPVGARILRSRTLNFSTLRPEIGNQSTDRDNDTYRFVSVLSGGGEWADRQWDWEASFSYGKNEVVQVRENEVNIGNLRHGLRIEEDPDNPDTYRCADEDARALGCVPVNLFGIGVMSEAAADWVRANLRLESTVELTSFQAHVATQELFPLMDGYAGMVVGVDWREDEQRNRNDDLSRYGGSTGATLPDSDISLDAREIFAEFNAPLLQGRPWAQYLEARLSARYSDYGLENLGDSFTSALSLVWRPADWLTTRTRYAEATRAPGMNEALAPLRSGSDDYDDPCDGIGLTGGGVVGDNCRSVPAILAAITDPDNPYHDDGEFDADPGNYAPTIGNRLLETEDAQTLTAGIVLSPTDWLNIHLDYYDIFVEGIHGTINEDRILELCYESTDNFFNQELTNIFLTTPSTLNPRCGDVFRDDSGNIYAVLQRRYNLDEHYSTGWDFGFRAQFPLESIHLPGRMAIQGSMNRVTRLENRFIDYDTGTLVTTDRLNVRAPKNRGYLRFGYSVNNWFLRWTVDYTGSVLNSRIRLEDYRDEVRNAAAAGLSPEQYPDEPLYLHYDAHIEHDFYASYRFSVNENLGMRLAAGINNVFDKSTPIVPFGDAAGGRATNWGSPWGPSLGRWYYLRFDIRTDFD